MARWREGFHHFGKGRAMTGGFARAAPGLATIPAFLFSGSALGLPGALRAVSHPHKLASA